MRSPFEIFRNKTLTTILFGMAMIAFVLGGAIVDPSNMSPTLAALFLASVLGGIGWIAGIRSKKSSEWGLGGVIVGLILAIAAALAIGPQDVVRADSGNIDQQQLNGLFQQRERANQFINGVFLRRENGAQYFQAPRLFGFGHPDQARDIVVGELLCREADRLGVDVSDATVNDFIAELSQGKVGASDVKEIRDHLGLSEPDLYNVLRQELKAQQVANLLYASTTLPPESYWDFYRQMNIQQSVGLVPLPVDAFIDKTANPTDAELQELFTQYKSNYPNTTNTGRLEEGRPGFRQPRKVQLAYVEVPYETIEKTVGEVSDEEIDAFYEEYYKAIPFTDDPVDGPDLPEADATLLPELTPAEPSADMPPSTAPNSAPDGTKPAPSQEGSTPDSPAPEKKPDSTPPETKQETPTPETESGNKSNGKPSTTNEENGASLNRSPDLQFVAFVDDEEVKPAVETAAEETTDEKPSLPVTDEAAPATTPPPPSIPRVREAAETMTLDGEASSPDTSSTPPQPRELDDELRSEIRDQILQRRTIDRMQELITEVYDEMSQDLSYFVTLPEDDPQYLSHEQAGEKLRKFAEERDLYYEETPLLTFRELGQSEEYPIGRAASDSDLQQSRSVPELAFSSGPTELYRPEKVLEFESGSRFVFWKTGDEAAYEPASLEAPGVREQVVNTWHELQAREKAQKRAQELAKMAEGVDKPLSEIFAETTVTGKEGGQVVSIVYPPRFSWLSHANVSPNPFNRPPPTRTNLRSVPGMIGDAFMETIVNKLQPGEVGVTHSFDDEYYYVVRVDERTYGPSPDFQAFRDRFTREPVFAPYGYSDYMSLANEEMQQYAVNWAENLFEQHNVDFSELDRQQNEPRS